MVSLLMMNHECPPIGGGGGYAGHNILKEFSDYNDILIDVICSKPGRGNSIESFSDNIKLYKVGVEKGSLQFWTRKEMIVWMLRARGLMKRLIKENDYDLCHAFFGFPTAALPWFSGGKLPYIISLRGSDVPGVNARFTFDYKLLGPLFKRIWLGAEALAACSKGLRERAGKFLSAVDIEVIPNGVDLNVYRPADDRDYSRPLRLVTVGRLASSKRLDLLFEAMTRIRSSYPEAKLDIAGTGSMEQELKARIAGMGLSEVVKFHGLVASSEMPDFYRGHDIYVSATVQEGMSNAMLEAMASGLPIVTTRCEGVEELIDDNGVVVEEASSKEIASAVTRLLGDLPRYESMCRAARTKAEQFSWSKVAGDYYNLYRELLGRRSGLRE